MHRSRLYLSLSFDVSSLAPCPSSALALLGCGHTHIRSIMQISYSLHQFSCFNSRHALSRALPFICLLHRPNAKKVTEQASHGASGASYFHGFVCSDVASSVSPAARHNESLGPALRSWQPTTRHQAPRCSSTGADTADTMMCWLARAVGNTARGTLRTHQRVSSVECGVKSLCYRLYVRHLRRSQNTHTIETTPLRQRHTHTLRRNTTTRHSGDKRSTAKSVSYEKAENSIVRIFVRRCSAMRKLSWYKKNSSRAVLWRASTSQRSRSQARPSRPVRVERRTCCCRWRSRPEGLDLRHVELGSCAHKQPHSVRCVPRVQGGAGMCGAAKRGSRVVWPIPTGLTPD